MIRFALLFWTLLQLVHANILLPGTAGPCRVQTKSVELTDRSRVDPYSSKNETRAIMVTSFVPLHCGEMQSTPYVPLKIAHSVGPILGLPNNTLELFRVASYASAQQALNQTREYPIILFSPGLGSSRLLYANLLEEVASAGYVVVSIDHPHDAGLVEFPNGRLVSLSNKVVNNVTAALDVRAADVSFTLDQLRDNGRSIIPPTFPGRLQLDRVVVVGHSLGGATAAHTMLKDPRFVGGLNFDGALHGPVIEQGLDRPFINFGEELLVGYDSWKQVWPHLRGFRLQVQLKGAKHMTFSDLPVVLDSAPSASALRNATVDHLGKLPGVGQLPGLGTVPGLRVKTILTDYITAACEFFITGKKAPLLRAPSPQYPEVMFTRR